MDVAAGPDRATSTHDIVQAEGYVEVVNAFNHTIAFLSDDGKELVLTMTPGTRLYRDAMPCDLASLLSSIGPRASIAYGPDTNALHWLSFEAPNCCRAA